jgi:hypothetical protein
MLVNGVVYQEGRILAEIGASEISAYVKRPEYLLWVALRDPDDVELANATRVRPTNSRSRCITVISDRRSSTATMFVVPYAGATRRRSKRAKVFLWPQLRVVGAHAQRRGFRTRAAASAN